tara:strand:- start:338 stop:679 length:342 start_codon:yes stop_codon:yes gene_type:complete
MNSVLRAVINNVGQDIIEAINGDHPDTQMLFAGDIFSEIEEYIPVWDDMCIAEKLECIEYVVKNPNLEDFGHSDLCQPKHQATAYFLHQYFCKVESNDCSLFDDLDFLIMKVK